LVPSWIWLDGLIVPDIGNTKRQFKSRTELFIGPRHHGMMGDTYDARSDVEHLHESKHLEGFNRAARLELVKKLEMMQYIVRSTLARIVLEPKLWPHFANTTGRRPAPTPDREDLFLLRRERHPSVSGCAL
jgi:hypothetical protein